MLVFTLNLVGRRRRKMRKTYNTNRPAAGAKYFDTKVSYGMLTAGTGFFYSQKQHNVDPPQAPKMLGKTAIL